MIIVQGFERARDFGNRKKRMTVPLGGRDFERSMKGDGGRRERRKEGWRIRRQDLALAGKSKGRFRRGVKIRGGIEPSERSFVRARGTGWIAAGGERKGRLLILVWHQLA